MDRFLVRLILCLLAASSLTCLAQNPAPSPVPETKAGASINLHSPASIAPEEARRRFQQMSPEQRQQLRMNLQRWKNMSKEERQALRVLAEKRRQRLEQNVDEFIKNNGWDLDPETRQKLIERFAQERKIIEDNLRKEMEEKRRPMLREMKEKLKAEFAPLAASPSPSPVATPVASPTP